MKKFKRYLIIGTGALLVFGILISIAISKINSTTTKTPEQIQAEATLQKHEAENRKAQAVKDAADLATWKTTKAGKLCTSHPTWQKDECDLIVARKVWIGMTLDMLKAERGLPNHVNKSNYGAGNQWQWCWENNDYSQNCFYGSDDGIITSYN